MSERRHACWLCAREVKAGPNEDTWGFEYGGVWAHYHCAETFSEAFRRIRRQPEYGDLIGLVPLAHQAFEYIEASGEHPELASKLHDALAAAGLLAEEYQPDDRLEALEARLDRAEAVRESLDDIRELCERILEHAQWILKETKQ